jgi:hypothetical protein
MFAAKSVAFAEPPKIHGDESLPLLRRVAVA